METDAALYVNFYGARQRHFVGEMREFCKIVLIKLSRIKTPGHVHLHVMTTLLWELDELSERC